MILLIHFVNCAKKKKSNTLAQEWMNFPKIQEPTQNSKRHMGDTKQELSWGPTDIRRHRTNFSRPGDLAPRICTPPPNQNCELYFMTFSYYYCTYIIANNRQKKNTGEIICINLRIIIHSSFCILTFMFPYADRILPKLQRATWNVEQAWCVKRRYGPNLRCRPRICLKGRRETMKDFGQDGRCEAEVRNSGIQIGRHTIRQCPP
jgi:hypothetical protein